MVLQHNLTAINANRVLGKTTYLQAKTAEKLASGYRINRAADDAVGLSISEKMRRQIRGLSQASLNAQDGISLVQTTEGALTEVHGLLQRMNELAIKASNGTMSENDRECIQIEVDQLVTEIDRICKTTRFNEKLLLQGDASGLVTMASKRTLASTISVKGYDGTEVDTGANLTLSLGAKLVAGSISLGTVVAESDKGRLNQRALNGKLKEELDKANGGDKALTLSYSAGQNGAADTWTVGKEKYTAGQLSGMGLDVSGVADNIIISKKFEVNDKLAKGIAVKDATKLAKVAVGEEIKATLKANRNSINLNEIYAAEYDPTYVADPLIVDLQVGAESTDANKISARINSMKANSLGLINGKGTLLINGKDGKNADVAVNAIAAAIQKVSEQRSILGSIQNRLEHTIDNLDNVVENTTAAESQLRDADMASEMVRHSNNNIFIQAGQAMLAQANQASYGVLYLLG